MSKTRHTHLIRQEAARLGFGWVGMARAEYMDEEARRLETWLNSGMHGQMHYMANHFEKRVDPRKLVEGAKSVISLTYNYYTEEEQSDPEAPKISKYAYGKDYHFVIKRKLKDLLRFIREQIGEVSGRCFVDSAPVLERDWARRSGVGWVGKNTLLIHPKAGSYFFLAELILDLELVNDHPIKDYCGTCTRCIDACPTEAISPEGYVVDGSKCISYFTIELKDAIPTDYKGKFENWMFGCDICQEVCPWNRFSSPHREEAFTPHPDLLGMEKGAWEELTEEVFREIFRGSAVKRTKYRGLRRNIDFLMKNIISLLLLFCPLPIFSQSLEVQIEAIGDQLEELKKQENRLKQELETLKLSKIQYDLREIGLPSDHYIMHHAMALSYSETHEQAAWVAHIILPDIIEGQVNRTNDFRPDPKVTTGTAIEQDYFLKYLQEDSTYQYDGFGYDRGHLAPSADFRWSETALSESYYYSNMAPQRADFNREAWADLEATLRGYIFRNPHTQLYVLTGGILSDGLSVVERSINRISIPKYFFKVVLDLQGKQGIGFIMPNQRLSYPLESYAVSIDEVEDETGFDFFKNLPDDLENHLESRVDKTKWIPELSEGNAETIAPPSLPPGHFNTVQAKMYMGSGEKIMVCGTVVSTRYSRSGNLWLNIDKKFPNQIFSVFIRKKDLLNFSTQADKKWMNQQVCFSGEVQDFSGVPTMRIEKEEEIKRFGIK